MQVYGKNKPSEHLISLIECIKDQIDQGQSEFIETFQDQLSEFILPHD